jgi:hypothetical protein
MITCMCTTFTVGSISLTFASNIYNPLPPVKNSLLNHYLDLNHNLGRILQSSQPTSNNDHFNNWTKDHVSRKSTLAPRLWPPIRTCCDQPDPAEVSRPPRSIDGILRIFNHHSGSENRGHRRSISPAGVWSIQNCASRCERTGLRPIRVLILPIEALRLSTLTS